MSTFTDLKNYVFLSNEIFISFSNIYFDGLIFYKSFFYIYFVNRTNIDLQAISLQMQSFTSHCLRTVILHMLL